MGKKRQPTNSSPASVKHRKGAKKRATPQQRMAFEKSKMDPENLLTSADVKRLFDISESCIKRWRRDRVIPYTKIGGTIYYFKDSIHKMLQERFVYPK